MTPNPPVFKSAVSAKLGARVVAAAAVRPGKRVMDFSSPLFAPCDAQSRIDLHSISQVLLPNRLSGRQAAADFEEMMKAAGRSGSLGFAARRTGDEIEAEAHFRDAMQFALRAKKLAGCELLPGGRIQSLLAAAGFALDCGEVNVARKLVSETSSEPFPVVDAGEWAQICDISLWKDAWLIAAVRQSQPDALALNVLGERYWKYLFGRCQLLTLNLEKASDLAQETWCRVLRTRVRLKPGGNFPAYLAAIATNLWRDWYRVSRRSGELAENRLESLDAAFINEDGGQGERLIDRLPDPQNLSPDKKSLLILDIDHGLERLNPQLREVLLARFIQGESCAEIAARYRCTEQTISGWVRRALAQMKRHLERAHHAAGLCA
jgi:RNA polymerase sigma factor (sigma-70 family)